MSLSRNTNDIENLKNLDRLPPFCYFVTFPLKVKGGSGSPVRAVALVPRRGKAGYSQPWRLKTRYRVVETRHMRTRAKG